MSVVDAVVVSRHSEECCPDDEHPCFTLPQAVELGTVVRVDLRSRAPIRLLHRSAITEVPAVRALSAVPGLPRTREGEAWIPCSLLRYEGRPL